MAGMRLRVTLQNDKLAVLSGNEIELWSPDGTREYAGLIDSMPVPELRMLIDGGYVCTMRAD